MEELSLRLKKLWGEPDRQYNGIRRRYCAVRMATV